MKWFKHSGNASRDAKLAKVISEYGLTGYGLYFYCVELIAGKTDADDLTFELEHDAALIASWTGTDTILVEKIMHRCIELGLFELADNGHITCFKLIKWSDRKVVGERIYAQMMGKIGENPRKSPSIRGKSPSIRIDKNRIDKNRIDKKAAKREYGEYKNVHLLDTEYSRLGEEWGISERDRMINVLSEGKKMKGYKYLDDNLAMRKWKAKEDSFKTPEQDMDTMIAEASRKAKEKIANERLGLR